MTCVEVVDGVGLPSSILSVLYTIGVFHEL